jgi:hypothetical protein
MQTRLKIHSYDLRKTDIGDYFCKFDRENKVKTSGLSTSEGKTVPASVSVYGQQTGIVPLTMQWTLTSLKMQQILL